MRSAVPRIRETRIEGRASKQLTDGSQRQTRPYARRFRLYSELRGFVLFDPVALDGHHGEEARGTNLLKVYTSTDEGDRVAASGMIVPVFYVDNDFYSVIVRSDDGPSSIDPLKPSTISTGWIIRASSGRLAVSGIGNLTSWNPRGHRVRNIECDVGWFSVRVQVGSAKRKGARPVVEFTLSSRKRKPVFKGDVGTPLPGLT